MNGVAAFAAEVASSCSPTAHRRSSTLPSTSITHIGTSCTIPVHTRGIGYAGHALLLSGPLLLPTFHVPPSLVQSPPSWHLTKRRGTAPIYLASCCMQATPTLHANVTEYFIPTMERDCCHLPRITPKAPDKTCSTHVPTRCVAGIYMYHARHTPPGCTAGSAITNHSSVCSICQSAEIVFVCVGFLCCMQATPPLPPTSPRAQ